MVKVVIIGGSGHVGTYLVPRLVEAGHSVTNVSRGTSKPYTSHPAWDKVDQVTIDRKDAEEKGEFGTRIAQLSPDVLVDMTAFDLEQVEQLVEAVRGKIQHYIFCSTVWVGGSATTVPTTEDEMVDALEPYGQKKTQIEKYLLDQVKTHKFPATSFRPGHIVGEGWAPVNPQGNLSLDVWRTISKGEELVLPDHGLATLHHVHADDCAQIVMCAIKNRDASIGECFNNVSPQAISMKWFAQEMYKWYGQTPRISFKPFDEWKKGMDQKDVDASWSHIAHSPCVSIEKSRRVIEYNPKYSSIEAVKEAVKALKDRGMLDAAQ